MIFGHLPDKCATGTAAATICALLAFGAGASAQTARNPEEIPLPPTRPAELRDDAAKTPAPATEPAKPPVEAAQANDCLAALRASGFEFEQASSPTGAQCGIDAPVRLTRFKGAEGQGAGVDFPDKPLLACRFALRFGQWTRDLAAPLASGRLGVALKAVHTGPGAECRTRNHIAGAKISAHASGTALDVADFVLSDGRRVPITHGSNEAETQFLATLRTAACGWFTTILGPGSDPFHAMHWHFDIMQHGSSLNYRICQ
jgi:hypothetical protein